MIEQSPIYLKKYHVLISFYLVGKQNSSSTGFNELS